MKKILLILAFTISLNCFSQAITVDTNNYTIPDLVNKVLINSPCVTGTNITWKTGTNFNSSNGIGFFQNSNPNFPMLSGVILSTGNVNNAIGPNNTQLNDGASNWTGDSDLENTLSQAGISMSSTNATVLEFDFTPTSTYFSFDFLFASEEYGNFQCQFSDAFAFLLTNTITGVTTNLAVVPKTNTPISVVTIRDYLYNSSCPSVNNQFFGSFNGGSAAATAPINFNGQTKLMNATANLIIDTPYHIKLVIADREDANSDSAIFIASDSFNIGQDVLGEDLSLNNNNALCLGDTHIIKSGLDTTVYNLIWSKDGVELPGETNADLIITQSGVYGISYQKKLNGCLPNTDEIRIDYLPKLVTSNPSNLIKCDNGASTYTYDLSINTSKIKTGLDPLAQISYHSNLSDANNNINSLPTNYSCNGNQVVYVRISVPNYPCFIVKNFKLQLAPAPIANQPKDLFKCLSTSKTLFNLTTQNSAILKGQSPSIYSIKYFKSLADATNNTNVIKSPANYSTGSTVVYARAQNNSDSSCYSITNFSLIINPVPLVDTMENIVTCQNYTLLPLTNGNYFSEPNGTGTKLFAGDIISKTQTIYIFNQPDGPTSCSASSSFNIKIIDPLELSPQGGIYCESFTLPPMADGGYFTEPAGAGTQLDPGSLITTSQTVYVYFQSTTPPFCVIDTDFNITILPKNDVGKHDNVFDCSSYTLPSLPIGNYFTEADGGGTKLNAGKVISTTQTIYVYDINSKGCVSQDSFSVIIGIETPIDISQCEPYALPFLAVGNYYTGPNGTGQLIEQGTVINLTQTIYIYIPTKNAPNCTDDVHFNVAIAQPIIDTLENVAACENYTLPIIQNGEYFTGPNGTGAKLEAGDILYSSQEIYIFKQSISSSGCSNQAKFEVTINSKPFINSRADIDICNFYILTDLEFGNYYTGPNGTGTMLPSGTKITTSQVIYIYATSAENPNCSSENSFNIDIFPLEADSPANVTSCDNYTLPALTIGNYYSQTGGPIDGNANLMHAGDVISSSTTLYVYTESGERINCTDENTFTITIVNPPVVNPIPNSLTTICDEDGTNDGKFNFNLEQFNPSALGTQTGTEYKVEYFLTQADAVSGVNAITYTDLKTVYVKVSNTLTQNCFDLKNIDITVYQIPDPKPIDGIICYDSKTNTLLNPYTIQSGLDPSTHTFQWRNDAGEIISIESNFQATLPGTYIIVATSNVTGCKSKEIPVVVSVSEPAIVSYEISDDFSNNQFIKVIASGNGGNYEYKLDSGEYQDSPIFENILSGIHTITVRDKNGCGSTTTDALVVNYPKFFTPNGDGYNDTWNINDLKDQPNANIYIYDRYGKMLKIIKPNDQGWDGNMGSQTLPSTDYWFTVNYSDDGVTKEFKSHFSLKR